MNRQGKVKRHGRLYWWLATALGCGCWGRTLWRSKDGRRWITWAAWFSRFDVEAESGELLSFDEKKKPARWRIFRVLGLQLITWRFPA